MVPDLGHGRAAGYQQVYGRRSSVTGGAAGRPPRGSTLRSCDDGVARRRLAVAVAVNVPFPGEWTLSVTIRIDDFDQYSAIITYRVR
jgi:hypothetical protein